MESPGETAVVVSAAVVAATSTASVAAATAVEVLTAGVCTEAPGAAPRLAGVALAAAVATGAGTAVAVAAGTAALAAVAVAPSSSAASEESPLVAIAEAELAGSTCGDSVDDTNHMPKMSDTSAMTPTRAEHPTGCAACRHADSVPSLS